MFLQCASHFLALYISQRTKKSGDIWSFSEWEMHACDLLCPCSFHAAVRKHGLSSQLINCNLMTIFVTSWLTSQMWSYNWTLFSMWNFKASHFIGLWMLLAFGMDWGWDSPALIATIFWIKGCNRAWRLIKLWDFEDPTFLYNWLIDGSEVVSCTHQACIPTPFRKIPSTHFR